MTIEDKIYSHKVAKQRTYRALEATFYLEFDDSYNVDVWEIYSVVRKFDHGSFKSLLGALDYLSEIVKEDETWYFNG